MANLVLLHEAYDIIISSGREMGTMKKIMSLPGFWQYVEAVSLANGAVLVLKDGQKYYYLNKEEKTHIIAMICELQLFCFGVEVYYCTPAKTVFINSIEKAEKLINSKIFEVKIAVPKKEIELLNWITNYLVAKRLNSFFDFITNRHFYYIELKTAGVNKYDSISREVKLDKYDQVVTLGDGVNDIHLLCFRTNVRYTTNSMMKVKGLKYIKDCKQLALSSGQDRSSFFTRNKVISLNNIVVKFFETEIQYKIEEQVYDILNLEFRPRILGKYESDNAIILERCTLPRKRSIIELILLLRDFHESTKRYGEVYELGSKKKYINWKEYLQERFSEWETTGKIYFKTDISKQVNILKKYIGNLEAEKVSLVHRDVRWDNVGERQGRYVLFDFELAMWGNPIWDYARLLYGAENADEEEAIFALSGYKSKELHLNRCLYAFSFLHYFDGADYKNKFEIEKCLRIVEGLDDEL